MAFKNSCSARCESPYLTGSLNKRMHLRSQMSLQFMRTNRRIAVHADKQEDCSSCGQTGGLQFMRTNRRVAIHADKQEGCNSCGQTGGLQFMRTNRKIARRTRRCCIACRGMARLVPARVQSPPPTHSTQTDSMRRDLLTSPLR